MSATRANNLVYPNDRRYLASRHSWIKLGLNGAARAGLTELGQRILGDIIRVEPKAERTRIPFGWPLATIESTSMIGFLYSPSNCIVESINSEVIKEPSLISISPYERGWIAEVRPINFDSDLKSLAIADHATLQMREREIRQAQTSVNNRPCKCGSP